MKLKPFGVWHSSSKPHCHVSKEQGLLWTCGRGGVSTLALSQPGGQIIPTLYWCPHQVLKATGAPAVRTGSVGQALS